MCQIRSIRLRPHSLRPSNLIPPELAQQRELIEAAIAVNEAPTLADAFQALADTGAALLGCDRLTIVAWNDDLSVGTIRGDTGTSLGELASPIDGSAASSSPGAPSVRLRRPRFSSIRGTATGRS